MLVGPAPLWRPPVTYNENRREQPPVARVIPEGSYNPYRKHPGTFGGEVSPPAGEQIDPDILTQPPTWMPNPDPGPWDVGTKKVDPREYGTWVRVAYPETPYSRGVFLDVHNGLPGACLYLTPPRPAP